MVLIVYFQQLYSYMVTPGFIQKEFKDSYIEQTDGYPASNKYLRQTFKLRAWYRGVTQPHRWGNGQYVRLQCDRSWVRAPIWSNERL